jgi:hypothetical protein
MSLVTIPEKGEHAQLLGFKWTKKRILFLRTGIIGQGFF